MKVITTTNSTNSTITLDTSNKEMVDLVNLLVSTVKENTTNELILGTVNTQASILNSKLGKDEEPKVVTTEVNLVELITPKLPLIIKVIKFVTFYEATIKVAVKPFKALWSKFKTKEEELVSLKNDLEKLEVLAKNTRQEFLDTGSRALKHQIDSDNKTIDWYKNEIAKLSS